MKQKVLLIAAILTAMAIPQSVMAHDFSYTYQGKTLYYNIVGGHAEVVRPGTGSNFDNYVTGNVEIPSTVSYNGNDYTVTALISMSSNGTFKGCSGLTSVTIPNSVTNIDQYAFYGCSGLTSVTIPNSVTSIGRHAFNNCSSLTSVTIPDSVTSIGQYAFNGCSDLASVTIGNSVTIIGKYAFYGCSDLTTVNFNATNCTTMGSSDSPVFGGCTNLATLNIGNYVTRIPDYAFYNCSGLTSVTIPNSVTSIGDKAFYDCYRLTGTLTIPNSVTSIGYSAFNNVKHIEYYGSASGSPWGAISMNGYIEDDLVYANSTKTDLLAYIGTGGNVTIPNTVTSIGAKAFYKCIGLTGTLTIPDSLTSIGGYAFYGCSGLTGTVTIPNSVTSIGGGAFHGCSGLTGALTIPSLVTIIGAYTFYGCSGLTSVTIGNSVTSIGERAFQNCSGLTSVTIGNSVTSIASWAFHSCSGLTEIISLALTAPVWLSRYVFSYVSSTIPVYIPCGSLSSYQTFWGEKFSNFKFPPSPFNINVGVANSAFGISNIIHNPTSCDSMAVIEALADYGYHFTQWDDGNTDNPRTITLTQDTAFTAMFAPNQYTITGTSDNEVRGTVAGGNTVDYLDSITLTATANYGYHFDHWNDMNTDNPRQVQVTQDQSYTAYFDYNQYSINLYVDTSIQGTCSGGGSYNYLSNCTITATADYGYHFTQWSDGSTDNPRTITLTQDTAFTAYFDRNEYQLTLNNSNPTLGTVSGSGTYLYLDTAHVVAEAIEHHHLVHWSDGNAEATRDIVITADLELTATFAIDTHNINVTVDISRGAVTGGGDYEYGAPCVLTAIPYEGYTFSGWSNGVTSNPYAFQVVSDVELTALFVEEGEEVYTVTVVSADPTMGTVTGGGQALSGGTVTISAAGNPGYRFARWNDNNTDSVRTVTVTGDITYTAYFESTTQGISTADVSEIIIYSANGRIVVRGAEGMEVRVFDMVGREVYHTTSPATEPSALPGGVYLVKVGTLPVRKVVVMR